MPTAKSPRENVSKAKRKPVEGTECRIVVNVFSPDHLSEEFVFTIPNIRGTTSLWTRKPSDIIEGVLNGLKKKYGIVK